MIRKYNWWSGYDYQDSAHLGELSWMFGVAHDGLEQQFDILVLQQLFFLQVEEYMIGTDSRKKEVHFVSKYAYLECPPRQPGFVALPDPTAALSESLCPRGRINSVLDPTRV